MGSSLAHYPIDDLRFSFPEGRSPGNQELSGLCIYSAIALELVQRVNPFGREPLYRQS